MFSFFQNGGTFMYVILIVSIIALAVFLERAAFLFLRLKLNTERTFSQIQVYLDKLDYRGALAECVKIERHPLGRILKAALMKSDKKDKEIERTLEQHIMKEIPLVKTRINYLTMFANISTLLGLLGTIVGLISAFKGVSNASAAMKQEILAKGISIAMFTTAFGLIVAIPCLVGFYILNNRSDYWIEQFEEKALRLLNMISAMKRHKETQCVH
jgi:biopolymer transport protein ExbB/TolQ